MIQLQQVWPLATMATMKAGIKLPVMLPNLSAIIKDMQPACEYNYAAPDGFYSRYRGTGLEVSLRGVAGGALAAGVLMPSLARTRQLAFRMTSGTNLSAIGKACLIYANDHDDQLPPNLEVLVDEGSISPKSLESKRRPKDFDGPSYVYIPGQTTSMYPGNIVAYEDTRYCMDGVNVLFLDSHVEFMKPDRFREELKTTCERLDRPMPEIRFKGE
jgi:prepilin-type processing-associated H-X9-DG protein